MTSLVGTAESATVAVASPEAPPKMNIHNFQFQTIGKPPTSSLLARLSDAPDPNIDTREDSTVPNQDNYGGPVTEIPLAMGQPTLFQSLGERMDIDGYAPRTSLSSRQNAVPVEPALSDSDLVDFQSIRDGLSLALEELLPPSFDLALKSAQQNASHTGHALLQARKAHGFAENAYKMAKLSYEQSVTSLRKAEEADSAAQKAQIELQRLQDSVRLNWAKGKESFNNELNKISDLVESRESRAEFERAKRALEDAQKRYDNLKKGRGSKSTLRQAQVPTSAAGENMEVDASNPPSSTEVHDSTEAQQDNSILLTQQAIAPAAGNLSLPQSGPSNIGGSPDALASNVNAPPNSSFGNPPPTPIASPATVAKRMSISEEANPPLKASGSPFSPIDAARRTEADQQRINAKLREQRELEAKEKEKEEKEKKRKELEMRLKIEKIVANEKKEEVKVKEEPTEPSLGTSSAVGPQQQQQQTMSKKQRKKMAKAQAQQQQSSGPSTSTLPRSVPGLPPKPIQTSLPEINAAAQAPMSAAPASTSSASISATTDTTSVAKNQKHQSKTRPATTSQMSQQAQHLSQANPEPGSQLACPSAVQSSGTTPGQVFPSSSQPQSISSCGPNITNGAVQNARLTDNFEAGSPSGSAGDVSVNSDLTIHHYGSDPGNIPILPIPTTGVKLVKAGSGTSEAEAVRAKALATKKSASAANVSATVIKPPTFKMKPSAASALASGLAPAASIDGGTTVPVSKQPSGLAQPQATRDPQPLPTFLPKSTDTSSQSQPHPFPFMLASPSNTHAPATITSPTSSRPVPQPKQMNNSNSSSTPAATSAPTTTGETALSVNVAGPNRARVDPERNRHVSTSSVPTAAGGGSSEAAGASRSSEPSIPQVSNTKRNVIYDRQSPPMPQGPRTPPGPPPVELQPQKVVIERPTPPPKPAQQQPQQQYENKRRRVVSDRPRVSDHWSPSPAPPGRIDLYRPASPTGPPRSGNYYRPPSPVGDVRAGVKRSRDRRDSGYDEQYSYRPRSPPQNGADSYAPRSIAERLDSFRTAPERNSSPDPYAAYRCTPPPPQVTRRPHEYSSPPLQQTSFSRPAMFDRIGDTYRPDDDRSADQYTYNNTPLDQRMSSNRSQNANRNNKGGGNTSDAPGLLNRMSNARPAPLGGSNARERRGANRTHLQHQHQHQGRDLSERISSRSDLAARLS